MKVKKFKSGIIMLVVLVLLIGMTAGCGSAETTTTSGTENGGQTTTTGTEEVVELSATTVLWSVENDFPYPIIEQLMSEANVDISWQVEGRGDWDTKKGVLLAGGNMPDLFFGTSLTDTEVSSGVFMDWAPYIDQTINVKRFLSEADGALDLCQFPDGSIFALPSKVALRPYSGDVFYVNKTWLDKLDLDIPTTTDDYYEMLKEFVTSDPNGNGIADEIGFTGVGSGFFPGYQMLGAGSLASFFPSFGVVVNNRALSMVIDGEVHFGPTMDGAKEAFIWLNKLFSEGLIDNEFFTLDFPTQAAKYRDENYLMVGSGNGWTMQNNVAQYVDDYVMIEPLIGPNGDQYWMSDPHSYRMSANTAAISASCENPDAAVRFFDLCYDEYNNFQLAYGSEGVGVTMDNDGNPAFLPVPEGTTDAEWKFVNGHDSMAPGWVSDEFQARITGENDMFTKYNADVFYTDFFITEAWYPLIKWEKDIQEELAILQTDINGYVDQMVVDFVMNGDVEGRWQNYLDNLERMGLPRLMEIYEQGYEANK